MIMKIAILLTGLIFLQPLPKDSMERGKKLYDLYCMSCHMPDGTGVPGLNPPLSKTSWVLGDKKRIINVVLNGLNEQVEIDGELYQNAMAPHDFMTDREVADVLTYVRNSFGNKASPVTPAEVKAVRASNKK